VVAWPDAARRRRRQVSGSPGPSAVCTVFKPDGGWSAPFGTCTTLAHARDTVIPSNAATIRTIHWMDKYLYKYNRSHLDPNCWICNNRLCCYPHRSICPALINSYGHDLPMSQPDREKEAFFSIFQNKRPSIQYTMRSSARFLSTRDCGDNTPIQYIRRQLIWPKYITWSQLIVTDSNFQQGFLQQMLLIC